jgi:hypothetical protein
MPGFVPRKHLQIQAANSKDDEVDLMPATPGFLWHQEPYWETIPQ